MVSSFHDWLSSQGKTKWTIREIIIYAKKYGHILDTGDASQLLTLSPRNRHHTLAALAALAKYQGQYDKWMQIRQRYNMKWSSGQESLQSFNRFFNPELSLESMLQQIAKMVSKAPGIKGQRFKFIIVLNEKESLSYGSRVSSFSPRDDITRDTALCCQVDG